jgi:glycosyltransferase involved in cell wall biosynthesis
VEVVMRLQEFGVVQQTQSSVLACDVSIVLPCLDEALSLPHCIANARQTLAEISRRYGLTGEIVVADNGSRDGSQSLAQELGARVVPVETRGYGAALIGGCSQAAGRFMLMGDADGSYDFMDGVSMIAQLLAGADLCVGSRYRGGIAPGAMPWKNRYIGNPILTGLLNLLFGAKIDDAHCGLRAITKDAFRSLHLAGSGMEFASEMIIKACLTGLSVTQAPAKLRVDLRDRKPHLRPWRDGWRHLRYLLMLSPASIFGGPSIIAGIVALTIFVLALLRQLIPGFAENIGNYWVIAAGGLATFSHLATIMALAAHFHGVRQGYRRPGNGIGRIARWLSLETMLIAAAAEILLGVAVLGGVVAVWIAGDYGPIQSVLAPVVGTTLVTIGAQSALSGFLLGVLAGNEANFVPGGPSPQMRKPRRTAIAT